LVSGKTFVTSRHFGVNPEVKPGPIFKRVLENKSRFTWLIKNIPGRIGLMPENTQGVIAQPIGKRGRTDLGSQCLTQLHPKMKPGLLEC